ncbi:MAG: 30S ribosomal protein S4 [Herpetosiphonaceae bacterium]|nr:MAG: 30S ribosomal protein S4 [Herpetosiphonaceae bacterium]
MARYRGPVCKLCRREGVKLMLKGERCMGPKCAIERRNYPPGQHGTNFRRRQLSDFGMQLREKQKARRIYGILERQFRRHYAEAARRKGVTGENLLQILERRLDNVVYRMGLADSRRQARQLVNHGHITINGRKTDIPSALVSIGDIIAVRPESRRKTYFKDLAESNILTKKAVPSWLQLDPAKMEAVVRSLPTRQDAELPITESLIVELYSR